MWTYCVLWFELSLNYTQVIMVVLSRTTSGPTVLDQEPPELPPMAEEMNQLGKLYIQSLCMPCLWFYCSFMAYSSKIMHLSNSCCYQRGAGQPHVTSHSPAGHVTAEAFICIYIGMTAHPSVVTHGSQSFLSQLVCRP